MRFSHFNMAKHMIVANKRRPKLSQKKFAFWLYWSHILDKTPESLLPIEVARNHPPILREVMRTGLSLETIERPMGLNSNSPIVITP